MPYHSLYIHLVWATKDREPILQNSENRKKIWRHIRQYGLEKEIKVDFINGYYDHCHCLIALDPNQSISKIVKLLIGESSRWINKNQLIEGVFQWQQDYFAISVSPTMLDKVREYIIRQELIHKKRNFEDEMAGINKIIKDTKET